jgi:hypothetical protein
MPLPVLLNKETSVMGGKTSTVAMTSQLNNHPILIHRTRKIGWGSDVSIIEDSIGGVDFDMPSSFHDGLGLLTTVKLFEIEQDFKVFEMV